MLSSLLSSLITVVLSGCFGPWTPDSSRLPFVSVFVPLVLSKLYPSFPSHYHSSTRLLWEEWISWSLFLLLAFLCGSLRDLGRNHTKPIIRYSVTFPYPGSLPYVTLLAFLLVPTCLLIISPLPCFFPGLQHLDGEESFYPLSFLSLLVALVFPTAFFTSLLTTVVLFRCFWDPRFSLSPTCV